MLRSSPLAALPARLRAPLAALALLLACDAQPSRDEGAAEAAEVERELDPLPAHLEARITGHLEQYGRHWPTFRFHGAVLVARGDTVAVDRAFGQADLIEGVPNETTTVFRIGTLSAQLTAAAIMRQVEAGTLSLQDPVAKHLPDWPSGGAITIEHLLSHRSGIPNYTDDLPFQAWKKGPRELDQTLGLFRDGVLEAEPGSEMIPSNSNYVLLGAILERVTGQSHERVIHEQILEPLGMEHTHYAVTSEPQAIGMAYNEAEYLEVVTAVHPSAFGPAGGWLSTTGDLLRFVRGLRDGELLSPRHVGQMQGLLGEGFGYAWTTSEVEGREVTTWPGLIDGFNASLLYIPSDDTTIIVLSNSEVVPAGQLVHEIASLVYDEEPPRREEPQAVPMDIAAVRPAVGRYLVTRATEEFLVAADPEAAAQLREIFVREVEGHLELEVPGHGRKRMHPLSEREFFFKDGAQTTARVQLRPDKAAVLVLESGGTELRFVAQAQ